VSGYIEQYLWNVSAIEGGEDVTKVWERKLNEKKKQNHISTKG
jgi:hypothetical protein